MPVDPGFGSSSIYPPIPDIVPHLRALIGRIQTKQTEFIKTCLNLLPQTLLLYGSIRRFSLMTYVAFYFLWFLAYIHTYTHKMLIEIRSGLPEIASL